MKRVGGALISTDFTKYEQIKRQRDLIKRLDALEQKVAELEKKYGSDADHE